MKKKEEAKAEVSSLRWAGVRRYCADADEATDVVESEDYSDPVSSIPAGEGFYAEEPEERVRATFGRNTPRSVDLETPVMDPVDAKHYSRSAAPVSRGRTCLKILRITNGQVFA